jgi:hypothetical protein
MALAVHSGAGRLRPTKHICMQPATRKAVVQPRSDVRDIMARIVPTHGGAGCVAIRLRAQLREPPRSFRAMLLLLHLLKPACNRCKLNGPSRCTSVGFSGEAGWDGGGVVCARACVCGWVCEAADPIMLFGGSLETAELRGV